MSAAVEFGTQCQPTFSTELITSVADILGRVTLRSIIKQNLFVQEKKSLVSSERAFSVGGPKQHLITSDSQKTRNFLKKLKSILLFTAQSLFS
jgi:hypothetical protein